jgi:putative flippase GtrA
MSIALKFQRFLGVGAVGFIIDATVFFGLIHGQKFHYAVARIAASLVALTTTWMLNRRMVFAAGRLESAFVEFARYLVASSVGAAVNLATLAAIAPFDAGYAHLPSYVVGAGVGLVVNFLLYDKFVFQDRKPAAERTPPAPETKP